MGIPNPLLCSQHYSNTLSFLIQPSSLSCFERDTKLKFLTCCLNRNGNVYIGQCSVKNPHRQLVPLEDLPSIPVLLEKKTKSGFTLNFILGDIGAKDKW